MKGFLLGRTPTRGFNQSNGHGRRQEGRRIVPRQANLVVQPSLSVSRQELEERLRAEARRQGKGYGLLFDQIDGGFTSTSRAGLQAFKVLPVMVYRVYVDGRPNELIRGADLIVSDVDMPGTDGFMLTKLVRASQRFQKLPIVLVTARESDSDKAQGIEVGADAYLVKSAFDQRNLLETIAQLL